MDIPIRTLSDLLLSLFSPFELRAHLRDGPDGEDVLAALPEASPREQAYAAILALQRRGALDDAWFDDLIHARPRRRPEIEQVRARWAGPPAAPLGLTAVQRTDGATLVLDAGGRPVQAHLSGDGTVSLTLGELIVHLSVRGDDLRIRVLGPAPDAARAITLQVGETIHTATLAVHPQPSGELGGDELLLDHRTTWSAP
jgi:hypothetical protein